MRPARPVRVASRIALIILILHAGERWMRIRTTHMGHGIIECEVLTGT
jgi:hypothetical protein